MSFESQIFDAIIFSFNGLMTIPTKVMRAAAFAEISRVLKSGGIFIFTTHDMKNERFLEYWKEEKINWHKGEQDKRLHEYGDLIFTDQKSNGNIEAFVHVPEYAEIVEETAKARLEIIHYVVRSKLCKENETTQECSGDCIFWVCRKKSADT
jgi:SAM-dependent methyltransferase